GDVIRFVKDGRATVDKSVSAASAPVAAPSATGALAAGKPAPQASADAEAAFLVQSLEPSVLRHLAALELAKQTTTVQVPADGLAKAAKSGGARIVDALAVRAAALALHLAPLSGTGVGVAFEGGKAPGVVEVPDAATASVHELAAEIKSARAAAQPAGGMPAVVVAPEGLYTPATLPDAAVVVVGQPRAAVSAADASAALDSALDDLTGGASTRPATAKQRHAMVVDIHVISASPAAAAFAARLKSILSSPELLGF
ncbi:hypothetical protein LPJ61_002843, partial [Coemansia biformis]